MNDPHRSPASPAVTSPPGDPERTLHLEFASRLTDLADALDRCDDFLEAAGAGMRLLHTVRLVAEEMVTNTIKYGYGDDPAEHRIRLTLALGPPPTLRIEDDGRAFDPTQQAPAVDLDMDLADRPIGGLGLHMVRASTDALHYRRSDEINRIDIVLRG